MSSLIALLDKHSHQTPDQIVTAIKNRGWIRLTEMTEAEADRLDNQRCVVGADNGGPEQRFWVVAGKHRTDNWTFSKGGWYRNNREYSEFWFILYEDYVDGLVPDRFAQQPSG